MAEIEYKGIKMGGSKLLIIIPLIGTLMGGLWGGFELYNRLLSAERKLNNLQPAAITAEMNRLESIYTVIREDLQGDIDSNGRRIDYNVSEITVAQNDLNSITRLTERMDIVMGNIEESVDRSLTLARAVETSTSEIRIWKLKKTGENLWIGTAPGVVGDAIGEEKGDAFNFRYRLLVPFGKTTLLVTFDDWMWLLDEKRLFNRAYLSKYGVNIGEVLITFEK